MKLCAGILYWGLKEELKTVELHGAGSQELTLSRPEFYLDRTKTFERNRVYVCSADHLPTRPSLSANVCLVCLVQCDCGRSRYGYFSRVQSGAAHF